jgi:hypothetical protein
MFSYPNPQLNKLSMFGSSSPSQHINQKILVFWCVCITLFISTSVRSVFAGPREIQATFEEISKSLGSDANGKLINVPNEAVGVNMDENIRLRRSLDEYSRMVDPAHVQIEERRRVMHKRLQERFNQTDRDNDGFLTRDEAFEGMPQILRHFAIIDTNGDGLISLEELEALQLKIIERQRMAVRVEPVESELTKRKTKDASIIKGKRAL